MKALFKPDKKLHDDIRRRERVLFMEQTEKYNRCYDAMTLYCLHAHFGMGRKRLKRFWEAYQKIHDDFTDYYQSDNWQEDEWIVKKNLLRIGVDVESWEKEKRWRE